MKTLSTRHAELCRLFPKGTFSIITSLVVWVMSLLASTPSNAADVDILIVGSTGDSRSTGNVSGTASAFDPTSIRTYLQNILQGAGVGTVNVAVENRSLPYDLAAWFHYPYPVDVETTTRWPNLRGQAGTDWDYVIVIGDPGIMETMPGLYAHGVAMVAQEVAKGGAETILLMPWSKAGSASVAHYKEVVYRAGRSGPYKVAPAALAWQAAGSPNSGTAHPTADGAFIAAASIYSTIWNQSASASTYVYNDTMANTVHTSVATNNSAVQYTGNFSFQNPFLMLGDKRRVVHFSEKGTSTEEDFKGSVNAAMDRARVTYDPNATSNLYCDKYNSNTPDDDGKGWPVANSMPIAWNHGRKFSEVAKEYVTNPAYWQLGMGFKYQSNTWANTIPDANDTHISQIMSQDIDLANYMRSGNDIATGQHSSARTLPWRLIWAQIHKEYSTLNPLRDGSGPHLNHDLHKAVGTYMYTMYSGRCPLDVQPNPITTTWFAQKVGYETAWRLGRCQSRAPGFKVMPSAATKTTIMGATTETMTVQFILPPLSNVTVNVSSSNPSVAIVSPSQLTFTPANYSTAQSITVTALGGLPVDTAFDVVYSTVSADEACNGVGDSWRYTALSNLPPVNWSVSSQSSTAESGTVTVTAQLAAASSQTITVPFTLSGTATLGVDYAITASPVTIPAGSTTGSATITITSDTLHEVGGETVILTMGTPTNGALGATTVHTATIRDDDNTAPVVNAGPDQPVAIGAQIPWMPGLMSTAAWYDAGDGGTITASAGAVSQWRDKSGNNRHLNQGTAANQPATGATINSVSALNFTGDVMTTASNPFGATINNALVMTVLKVDTIQTGTLFSLSGTETNRWQSHAPWSDGTLYFDCGGGSAPNRIYASFGVSAGSVVLAGFYGSTTNNVQQVYKNGSLLVSDASGHAVNTAGNLSVGGMGANYQDATIGEFIVINGTVDAATRQRLEGYLAHKWGLTASLPVDHPYKSVVPMAASVVANLDGTVSDGNGDPVTTTWTVVSGPGSVSFGNPSAVDTTATFTVAGTYTFRLTANDTYGPVSDDVVITVTSGTPTPTVAWTAANQASVGESGTLTVTAQLSAASAQAVTVPFTVTGTASGADYSITASPITIAAGATTGTATITITADTLDEPNETVILTMGTPTNATLGATTVHTATITDDDVAAPTPTVAWTAASQSSAGESGAMTVTAQLSASSASTVTVPFTVTGTATGADRTISASPITIAAGATTGTATITITTDTAVEGNETVILTMGTPTNATLGATTVHTATITDDDVNSPPVVNAGLDQALVLGAAVAWTPGQIATTAWFDPSDATTITASSGAVSQWRDKSGNNRHLNQGTAANQPATGATINSLNALNFTGDVMTTASNPFGTTVNNAFVIAVHKVDSVASGTLFSLTGSETVANRWQSHAPWSDGTLYFDCGGASAPNRVNASYGVSAGNVALTSFYGSTTENVQQVYKNGSLLVGDASGHAVNTAGNIMVGGVASSYQDTTLGEFIIINGTVDVATRQKLEGYLAHKWGQAANLPADHPYKTAAPTVGGTIANLDGTVSDANGDPLTTTWSFVSGPGSVTFGNASAVDTTATFTVAGTYTLRLTANDGSVSVSDDVVITVTQSAAAAYDGWIAAAEPGGGVDATFSSDANSDGLANGLSWLLGAADPEQNGNELLPQSAQSGGNLTMTFKMLNSAVRGAAVLSLQYSRDLGVTDPWTNHTIQVPDTSGIVGGVNFVITPINGTDHNQVQVTIPASAAGGTGKVFARMRGMLSP